MTCRKCKRETPPDALYCPWCGVSLNPKPRKRKPRTRPNGAGSAYQRGKYWTAQVVVGWRVGEDNRARPVYRTRGGFRTKRDALDYCVVLKQNGYKTPASAPQLQTYWNTYERGELAKLSKSKQVCYRGAWKKLSALHWRPVDRKSTRLNSSHGY